MKVRSRESHTHTRTHLLTLVRQVVSVHEASSLGGVAMQVYIIRHSAFLGRDLLRGGGACHYRDVASALHRLVLIERPRLLLDSALLPALLQLHRDWPVSSLRLVALVETAL